MTEAALITGREGDGSKQNDFQVFRKTELCTTFNGLLTLKTIVFLQFSQNRNALHELITTENQEIITFDFVNR